MRRRGHALSLSLSTSLIHPPPTSWCLCFGFVWSSGSLYWCWRKLVFLLAAVSAAQLAKRWEVKKDRGSALSCLIELRGEVKGAYFRIFKIQVHHSDLIFPTQVQRYTDAAFWENMGKIQGEKRTQIQVLRAALENVHSAPARGQAEIGPGNCDITLLCHGSPRHFPSAHELIFSPPSFLFFSSSLKAHR